MIRDKSVVIAIAIWLVAALTSGVVYADNSAVVIGSYQNLSNAKRIRDRAQEQLSMEATILETEIRRAIWYRVVIRHQNALQLVSDLKQQGYKDAWFLKDTTPFVESLATTRQKTITKSPDKKETTSDAVPEEAEVSEIPSETPLTPVVVAIPPAAIGGSGTGVQDAQWSTDEQPTIMVQAIAGLSGVDATSEPIVITKLAKVDIKVDGKLDEAVWADIPAYDNMSVVKPDLLITPRHETSTRIFYTDEGIYVGISAEQPADKLIPRLSSRDGDLNRDGTIFYIDTSGEGLYGFFFGVNLGGTLIDGTLLPERQLSRLWDGAWYGDAATTVSGYSTEMFLPWSMMSMPEGVAIRKMAFSVTRTVAYLDEEWQWPALPSSKPLFMSGLQPIQLKYVTPRQQLAFYPFSAATVNNIRERTDYRAGMDIFWRPSTNLQVTATLNPDFGTVESDDVIVNLTDFEDFFPEKRLFFLEGNDTFITSPRSQVRSSTESTTGARNIPSTFVLAPTTLVNTRRIGGPAIDPVIPAGVTIPDVELGKPTALQGAAKITGQSGQVRYGALFASEESAKFYGTQASGDSIRLDQEGRDFGVLRFIAENTDKGRRSLGWISTIVAHPSNDAITHGIDAHYLSPKGNFFYDAQAIASDTRGLKGYGGFVDFNYIPKQGYHHRFSVDYFDDQLDVSDFGFIRRNDATTIRYTFSRVTSQLKKFRNLSNSLSFSHEYNDSGQIVRSSIFNRNVLTFNNRNQLTTVTMWRPGQWDDRNSDGNGTYRTEPGGVMDIAYGTATSKILSTSIGINAMTEPLGDISYTGKVGLTFKPNDRFSLDLDYSYRRTDHWMVHLSGSTMGAYDAVHIQPKLAMDLFLTAKQQLRLSVQWVGIKASAQDLYQIPIGDGTLVQITNGITVPTFDFTISRLTTQLRYRWEIAPLSDLFLVYTRGSNLPNRQFDEFGDLFHDALTDPLVDQFVIKLRYRFGN